jgi:C4-type Zn-finger protein
LHDQVAAFIAKLRGLLDPANMPFKLVLDDPSGNSFIDNPIAPKVRVDTVCDAGGVGGTELCGWW